MKRRNFIKDTAIAASAFSIIPSHVLSRRGNSPNDKIQIGFIGAGRQGTGLMENFVNYNEAEVISVSDVDFEKMALFSKKLNQKLTENKTSVYLDKLTPRKRTIRCWVQFPFLVSVESKRF